MTLRVGIAGCGWIAPYQARGWRLLPQVTLAGVCDLNLERARQVASEFDIPYACADASRMMDACQLDILDIATPPESHKQIALEAMARGVHVLCQKPLALNLPDAGEMIRAAESAGLTLYVNEMLRFCPWYRKTRQWLDEGRIGRPAYARLFTRSPGFLEVGPERRVAYGFRDFLRRQPRVIMLEQSIHFLDVARYLFGEPDTLYAATQRLSPLLTGEDIATILLRYDTMTVVLEDSWSAHGPERSGMEIEGGAGAILLSHARKLQLYDGARGQAAELEDYSQKSWPQYRPEVFAALFRDMLDTVARGGRTAQARDNLATLAWTFAAYDSAEHNQVVRVRP